MQPILSLGASSIGVADMVRLRHTVGQAAARLPFQLEWRTDEVAETADVLFVDVDTMYGHIDWLRAQAGGRALIALTSRPNGAHDHELARDAEPAALETLLLEFAELAHAKSRDQRSRQSSDSATTTEFAAIPAPHSRLPATRELPVLAAEEPVAAAEPEPQPDEPPPPPRDAMSLRDWLRDADGVSGLASLQTDDGMLVVDRAQSVYYGPSMLKPLLELSRREIARDEWSAVDADSIGRLTGNSASMPLARLRLLAGLGAFDGALASDLDPTLPFRLPKWPQIEREFPRHMRIATALMKGPATIDELVAQTGLPYAEVADFLNGFVAAGFIEQPAPVVEPEPVAPASGESLMGRLRAFGRKP